MDFSSTPQIVKFSQNVIGCISDEVIITASEKFELLQIGIKEQEIVRN